MAVGMPNVGSGMIDPKLIDQLIEVQRLPIEKVQQRKDGIKTERAEYQKFSDLVGKVADSVRELKDRNSLVKLKVESSNPEIVSATATPEASEGSYELEVNQVASPDREVSVGFTDRDKSFVGFGYLTITKSNGEEIEVIVEPGSTLQDVVGHINGKDPDIKASIVNTNIEPAPYRLVVSTVSTGEKASIHVDGDTSFLSFVRQTQPQDLDVNFNGLHIGGGSNSLNELAAGVNFEFKKASPGSRVTVNVSKDIDASIEGIKKFVNTYNELAGFVNKQFQVDEATGKAGILAGDSSIRMVLRSIQSGISFRTNSESKYKALVDIGISTDPKTGTLNLNESKLKEAMNEDFSSVVDLVCNYRDRVGVAGNLDNILKTMTAPGDGVVKNRLKGYDNRIKNLDQSLERQERLATQKEQAIRKRFSSMEERLAKLNSQSDYLQQRLGGAG